MSARIPSSTGRQFVGREAELRVLTDALDGAVAGRGSLTLVTGEIGIGKTAVLEEHIVRCQERDLVAAAGRSFEQGAAPPYAPWVQLLQRLARAGNPPSRPSLRRWLVGAHSEVELDRYELFDLVTSHLFETARERPLVLVLEDLQWADGPSLLLLREMAGDLPTMRVQVIATYREGRENDPARERLLRDLERQPGIRRLVLAPLDDEEVARYLEASSDGRLPGRRRTDVLRWIAGNPLYMSEAARLAESAGDLNSIPPGIRQLAERRLSTLPAETADLLATAAVIGSEFDLRLLASAAAAPLEQVAAQLDAASQAGLVIASPERHTVFRFAQEMLREALYQGLLPSVREERHRMVAESIESTSDAPLEDNLASISYQWIRAGTRGEHGRAALWTLRAADHAVQRLAYEEGVRLYEAASDLPGVADRSEVTLKLARAQYLAGDIESAYATCLRVAESARAESRPRLLAEAALVLEGIGDRAIAPELTQMCEEALRGLGSNDADLRARLLGQLAVQLAYGPDFDRTAAVSAEAVEAAGQSGDINALVSALRARQLALSGPEGVKERLSLASRMIDIGSSTRQPSVAMWGRLWRLDGLLQLADMPGVDAEQVELESLVGRLRQPLARWHLVRLQAARAAFRGDFETSVSLAGEARDLGRRAGQDLALGLWTSFRTMIAVQTGDESDLQDLTAEWRRALPVPVHTLGMARGLLAIGREAEAKGMFEVGVSSFAVYPRDYQWLTAAAILSELACRFQSRTGAELVYPLLQPFAGQLAVPGAGPPLVILGCLSLHLGMLASMLGKNEAPAYFDEAVAVHDRLGARPYAAQSRFEYATHLAAGGRHAEANGLAIAALAAARELGMRPLVARLEHLLETPAMMTNAGPLSRRETEIAAEVAKGLTNKQIAGSLHLSERTVETHVQNILGKLGFRTRTQVAAWATGRPVKG
ncbi:MAG: helix-turn-helix transcriptional regulator [Candidatus Dormibacteria bacterium]